MDCLRDADGGNDDANANAMQQRILYALNCVACREFEPMILANSNRNFFKRKPSLCMSHLN
jgi:hypothetical protein